MPQVRIANTGEAAQRVLFGPMDKHLRRIREHFGVRISARNEVLTLEGDDVDAVEDVARRLKRVLGRMNGRTEPPENEVEEILLGSGKPSSSRKIRTSNGPRTGTGQAPHRMSKTTARDHGGSIAPKPKTPGQERYIDAIREHDVVFALGPAGTGKTFLAVVEAVRCLRDGTARKIILTRPAVEAGEKLGFLPGDFQAKINPYLRPLYDALGELLTHAEVQRYFEADVIEIVPLAYMRGRTLKEAFIILDEAQNTTPAQMKMFLTRMGERSKVVVNGDASQVDLPGGTTSSGLSQSVRILEDVPGIAVVRFAPTDILRHPLVQRIVDAYDREDDRRAANESSSDADDVSDDESQGA